MIEWSKFMQLSLEWAAKQILSEDSLDGIIKYRSHSRNAIMKIKQFDFLIVSLSLSLSLNDRNMEKGNDYN